MAPAWKDRLQPASFRGAEFHVETQTQAGGRRTVLHEFPKRDDPYAEDMGRRARRFTINAYIIDEDYIPLRDALIDALEEEGAGTLVLPTTEEQEVSVDSYSSVEQRTQGGMVTFDITFVEAGEEPNLAPVAATQSQIQSKAATAGQSAASSVDQTLKSGGTVAI